MSLYKITIPANSEITAGEVLEYLKEVVYIRCVNPKGVPRGYKVDLRDGDMYNLVPSNLVLVRC